MLAAKIFAIGPEENHQGEALSWELAKRDENGFDVYGEKVKSSSPNDNSEGGR
jgi:hypothetical protein